jgi:OOP family OmpA-OmpF porin
MIGKKPNRKFIVGLCFAAACMSAPTQAGILLAVLTKTGIIAIVTPITTAVGIDLDDTLVTVDGVVTEVLGGDLAGGELNLSEQEEIDLRGMDTPVTNAAVNFLPQALAAAPADDQPALIPLVNLDPVFIVGQIQTQEYRCSDADGDGVCDQDDQCLKTPAGKKVLANGCYLDGPRGVVVLEGVFFDKDSNQLSIPAQQVLRGVAEVIKQSSASLFEVGGFTDDAGDAAYNLQLSARRAAAVRDYLFSLGIAKSRLQVRGYGEASPRADNATPEGRAMNRRVELKIVNRG